MDLIAMDADDTAGDSGYVEQKGGWEIGRYGGFLFSFYQKGVEDGFDWACSGVYGPNDDSRRGLLWDELVEIRHHWDIP